MTCSAPPAPENTETKQTFPDGVGGKRTGKLVAIISHCKHGVRGGPRVLRVHSPGTSYAAREVGERVGNSLKEEKTG